MTDLSIYAGRWIALTEQNEVATIGASAEAARYAARSTHPKEHIRLVWISTIPPYLALPEWPLEPLRQLFPQAKIWLAGGPVRDLLLGRSPHDWDFAVAKNAIRLARKVADALDADYYTLDKERDTGRVIAIDPGTNQPITLDFARLRGSTIAADLKLRDFTINAMAMTLDGQIIDPYHGQTDLENQLIRITNANSFKDDPARLLRAIRQANKLNFTLEKDSAQAMHTSAASITTVSPERVRAELQQMLRARPSAQNLSALKNANLLNLVLPEVQALSEIEQSWPHEFKNTWDHTLATLSAVEGILALLQGQTTPRNSAHSAAVATWAWTDLEQTLAPLQPHLLGYLNKMINVDIPRTDLLKWGALLHDIGKSSTATTDEKGLIHFYGHDKTGAQQAQNRLESLRFPSKTVTHITTLIRCHMYMINLAKTTPTRRAIHRFFRTTGDVGINVVLLSLADAMAVWGHRLEKKKWRLTLQSAAMLLKTYFEEQSIINPPQLLNGNDLLAMGIPKGPQIGKILLALKEAQAAGEVQDKNEALTFIETWQLEPPDQPS